MNARKPTRRTTSLLAVVAALAMLASACGGGGDDSGDGDSGSGDGTPVAGGSVVYGLENETSGGWCLPESQLAISGIQVAKTIYDTLTAPNEDDEYVPFLAESVEPNEDYTQWTITLRDGVTFHDGIATDRRGGQEQPRRLPGRVPGPAARCCSLFVFEDIASVDVVDDLTLTVTTSIPWPALPAPTCTAPDASASWPRRSSTIPRPVTRT